MTPPQATVWYYVRADNHHDAAQAFGWVHDIARGAATMTRTKLESRIETDCHELVTNTALSKLLQSRLQTISPPSFNENERMFAARLQQGLVEDVGRKLATTIDDSVHPLDPIGSTSKGSTDVGDISWYVPTGGLRITCFPEGTPGHSWQNVASIGSPIGEKGLLYAAKVLSAAGVAVLEHPEIAASARQELNGRMKDRPYTTLIPEGQLAPRQIR